MSNKLPTRLLLSACLLAFLTSGNLLLVSSAEAQARPRTNSGSAKKPKDPVTQTKPRQTQGQSAAGVNRTHTRVSLPQQRSSRNIDKAANRRSSGQSATSVLGQFKSFTGAVPSTRLATINSTPRPELKTTPSGKVVNLSAVVGN